ncbi:hypothetical protein DPMN_105222 [Dreissena polymorpha]|uniref:Uncharacterized protein n=1 Tax=Dreissena polymorpha TaxID=45954 RepID=A0A9D4K259_DREPO|nr:hypothetical protein DPMN_105222 [Dreissena polymorpha]
MGSTLLPGGAGILALSVPGFGSPSRLPNLCYTATNFQCRGAVSSRILQVLNLFISLDPKPRPETRVRCAKSIVLDFLITDTI